MYGVGGSLEENSPVAQWLRTLNRVNLDEFYQNAEEVPNEKVREYGQMYAKYFSDMVIGDDVIAPDAFPFDITEVLEARSVIVAFANGSVITK